MPFESVPIGIQGVGIFHREFAHADQPGARARIVAEFGLNVIDQARQVAVGADFAPHQVADRFLVGHGKHQVALVAVFQPSHFCADRVPAPGFFPNFCRQYNRHGQFLPANSVHFLTQDGFDFLLHTFAQRQHAENAGCHLADVTGTHQVRIPAGLGFGRSFAQGLRE